MFEKMRNFEEICGKNQEFRKCLRKSEDFAAREVAEGKRTRFLATLRYGNAESRHVSSRLRPQPWLI